MTGSPSPLQAIYDAELTARRRLEAVRNEIDAQIAAARHEAKEAIAAADRAGKADAQARLQAGLQSANHEAEAIIAAARTNALTPPARNREQLKVAVSKIISFVLPPSIPVMDREG